MKREQLEMIQKILDSSEGLYEYLDWVASQGGGYEIYLQHLIIRGLRGKGIDASLEGKGDADCDFFIEGEGVELKTPRPGWGDLYKKAFEGHPNADSYLFIIKGDFPVFERATELIPLGLESEDWWLLWVGKCE